MAIIRKKNGHKEIQVSTWVDKDSHELLMKSLKQDSFTFDQLINKCIALYLTNRLKKINENFSPSELSMMQNILVLRRNDDKKY